MKRNLWDTIISFTVTCCACAPILCLLIVGVAQAGWAAEGDKPKTPEQQAWEQVDSLNKESLHDFLQKFPAGDLAEHARVAVELQDKLTGIKAGKEKSVTTISFASLGDTWTGWQKRNPDKGVIGYFTSKGEKYNELGWFKPEPLSGGKTSGSNSVSFDARGLMVSPTGTDSIIAFRTGGLKFELFKGILFETPGDEPFYFGVIEGRGLVHLKGAGKVALADGKVIEVK